MQGTQGTQLRGGQQGLPLWPSPLLLLLLSGPARTLLRSFSEAGSPYCGGL